MAEDGEAVLESSARAGESHRPALLRHRGPRQQEVTLLVLEADETFGERVHAVPEPDEGPGPQRGVQGLVGLAQLEGFSPGEVVAAGQSEVENRIHAGSMVNAPAFRPLIHGRRLKTARRPQALPTTGNCC